jgi:beta-glucanase (GH16 family)
MNLQRRIILGAVGALAVACTKDKAVNAASKNAPKAPASSVDIVNAPAILKAGYKPSFSDDFTNTDSRRLSEAGTVTSGDAPAWRSRYRHPRKDIINKEKQIYVDPAYAGTGDKPLGINPFLFDDGKLSIIAERTPPQHLGVLYGQQYTSGAITTELSHQQTYGFFEMRAKLPVGKGFWPSFWLMPVRQAWPPEIDIVEASGEKPGVYHFAVRNPGDKKGAASDWLEIGTGDNGWQTFACEWTKERIAFFVDGKRYWHVDGHKIHEPMYMLANLALGSHDKYWIPDPDESTPLPASMQIDYIKAFARA